ncbi:MAG: ribose 5-phosphate isomerase B [Tissierellia bacterium]|nr:ribose 5-phosphate isomerase B [Tissierellia bacterium]
MKIAITSDHAGIGLKSFLVKHLQEKQVEVIDMGPYEDASVDYPDYAKKMCQKVLDKEAELGIAICGTGIGMSMACNKVPGIRAALCSESYSARLTRLHNNSNVLCLGARVTGEELAMDIVDTYISTDFSGDERHERRIGKLEGGINE